MRSESKHVCKESIDSKFLNLLYDFDEISTLAEFKDWIKYELRKTIKCESAIFVSGKIISHNLLVEGVINYGYCEKYLDSLIIEKNAITSPLIANWIANKNVQIFESANKNNLSKWHQDFFKSNLSNVISYGIQNEMNHDAIYFSFGNIQTKMEFNIIKFVKMLGYVFHAKKHLIFSSNKNFHINALTTRQSEIIELIRLGMTNKIIAQKLNCSEFTIRNHVQSIFQKLHVKNRTEAAYTTIKDHFL